MPESCEPLDVRRQAVTVVFIALVVVSIAACVSDVLEINLMDRIIAGENVTDSEATANDNRQATMALLQVVGLVAGAIVFIRWLVAAYRNADVVAPGTRRYGHGWAIGSWFVPVLNLWRPKQIVNDVWSAGGRDPVDATPGLVLTLWWPAWLVMGWVGNAAVRSWFSEDTPEDLRNGTVALAVADGIQVIAAILAILVVRQAGDRLDGRAAALSTPPDEPPGEAFEAPERPAGVPA